MRLNTELWVSTARHEVFRSFEDAAVLETMSPPWVRCKMVTPAPAQMRSNAHIEYRFRLHGIPFRWEAVVTVWNPPSQFVDEQQRGPYRRWRHTHTFVEDRGGTIIRDEIEFKIFGGAAIAWFVARDLRKVFRYRHHAVLGMFKQPQPWPEPHIEIVAS